MANRGGSNSIEDFSEVTSLMGEDQFLFFQNSTKKARRVSRKNLLNSPGIVVQGKIIDPEYGDLGVATATATSNAATALSTAQGAQTSANGKNKIFYQTSAPTNPISGYSLVVNDLWFDTDGGYRMAKWNGSTWVDYGLETQAIANVDAGKITAGFVSSQAIELANSGAFIQSNNFIITWAVGLTCKTYNAAAGNLGKSTPSDVVRCKVLQNDGSYKAFKSLQDHTSSSLNQPPSSGANSYWEEITVPTISIDVGNGSTSIDNFGFNIVGQGTAEFSGGLFRGAVIAKEGFFGTKKNAARIDSNGLTIGDYGRIKSAGIGYNGSNFTSTSGSGGFFLGNTQAENSTALYQFFIGDPSGNYMRWNGSALSINGSILGTSTIDGTTASTVVSNASTALSDSATAISNAATAQSTANGAQNTADGRNRIFYQPSAPTSPAGGYNLINGDLWFDTSSNYAMYTWNTSLSGANKWEVKQIGDLSISGINAGKITAGFIGAQVIAINGSDGGGTSGTSGSGGYIESTSFVLTWPGADVVNIRKYDSAHSSLGRIVASDVVQVKVLQSDGSYKLFRAKLDQAKSPSQTAPPASGDNTYWQEITSIPTFSVPITSSENATVENFGFRIASNGYGEFSGGLFRGAVIAKEGFFGTTREAVKIDGSGLLVGSSGRISNGVTYSSGFSGSGFYLGYAGSAYQFFIGSSSGNKMLWNGSNLSVTGQLVGVTSDGGDTEAGLVINSGFGIRYGDKTSVLTITGGDGNGVTNGAQIDFIGINYTGSSNGAQGRLDISAGYSASASPAMDETATDGVIQFRTAREYASASVGAVRMRIEMDGTVRVVYTQTGTGASDVPAGVPNSGAGKLVVETSVESPTYLSTSSKRFKKKIKNLKNGLEIVNSLRPVSFDWKNKDLKNDIGLIAEEVNQVIPSVIGFNNNGEVSSIDYSKLTPFLIQAVKELSLEVDKLKNKIK